jgi:ppGpp synthetase/RelA/SpoT-type nucleotidyltranferase
VKSWDSINEKLERVSLKINSVNDLQDLVGLRIHLLFNKDSDQVLNIIRKSFTVIREYNTQKRLKEDQFGYSSFHFVISIPETWLSLPTLAGLKGYKAEIQIRTLAQHIWAEASHFIQYKMEASVPPSMLRSIYRVSALLETIDLEFDRLMEERERYRKEIKTTKKDNTLNVDILEETLDELFPKKNKDTQDKEDLSSLLEELNFFGITTYKQLKALINKHEKLIFRDEAEYVKQSAETLHKGKQIVGTSVERIKEGVYFTYVGLARTALTCEFGKNFTNYLSKKNNDKNLKFKNN